MIYKIYSFQYEANKFLYGIGKGHTNIHLTVTRALNEMSVIVN